MLDERLHRGSRALQAGEVLRVAICLDEMRPQSVKHVTLALGKAAARTVESDPEMLVDTGRMELPGTQEVRDRMRTTVPGGFVAGDHRVIADMGHKSLSTFRRIQVGLDDSFDTLALGVHLVPRDRIRRHQRRQYLHRVMAQRVKIPKLSQ